VRLCAGIRFDLRRTIVEAALLPHHGDEHLSVAGHVEDLLPGVLQLEPRLPQPFEVRCVHLAEKRHTMSSMLHLSNSRAFKMSSLKLDF
jgi:hypothetical protein